MKPCPVLPSLERWRPAGARKPSRARNRAGFSLPEMMIACGLFSLAVVGSLYAHVLGLKMSTFTQSKLRATHNARAALNIVRDDVRSSTTFTVGTGNFSSFTVPTNGAPQQGNALQIWPTADTNTYIRYYTDPSDQTLKRIANGGSSAQVIARYVTNQLAFGAEDFAGNVLTNNQNDRVLKMTLEFYQWEFAVLQSGGGNFADYYRLQTKVARRATQ